MTYEQAKAHAEHFACVTGCDYGVMRNAMGGCSAFILPPVSQRTGDELRCEVVRYADIGPQTRAMHIALDERLGDNWNKGTT